MESKRAWWAWRPASARDTAIDYRILFGIAVATALLGYLCIVVAYVRSTSIDRIGTPLLLIALGAVLAASFARKMREPN